LQQFSINNIIQENKYFVKKNSNFKKISHCIPNYKQCKRKDNGWIKKKWSPILKGTTCWINNGATNKRINKEDLEKYQSDGWVKGALQQHQPRCKSNVTQ
jgi:hypothetical protein